MSDSSAPSIQEAQVRHIAPGYEHAGVRVLRAVGTAVRLPQALQAQTPALRGYPRFQNRCVIVTTPSQISATEVECAASLLSETLIEAWRTGAQCCAVNLDFGCLLGLDDDSQEGPTKLERPAFEDASFSPTVTVKKRKSAHPN
jgi:hypothetical protein